MMATRRSECLVVADRVGLRLVAAVFGEDGEEVSRGEGLDRDESSGEWLERNGLEVKKCRLRGRLAGVVRWNERRGRRVVTVCSELWKCLLRTLRVMR